MPIKYQKETDPAQKVRTVRLGMTPYRRQAREKGGRQRYRLALLYFAVFGVLILSFASAISERRAQRADAVQTGVGRIVSLEAPVDATKSDAMGQVGIAFPADAAEPAIANWAVPFELWQQLAMDDVVAVRYEGGRNAPYRLLDAGYVALPRDDTLD